MENHTCNEATSSSGVDADDGGGGGAVSTIFRARRPCLLVNALDFEPYLCKERFEVDGEKRGGWFGERVQSMKCSTATTIVPTHFAAFAMHSEYHSCTITDKRNCGSPPPHCQLLAADVASYMYSSTPLPHFHREACQHDDFSTSSPIFLPSCRAAAVGFARCVCLTSQTTQVHESADFSAGTLQTQEKVLHTSHGF